MTSTQPNIEPVVQASPDEVKIAVEGAVKGTHRESTHELSDAEKIIDDKTLVKIEDLMIPVEGHSPLPHWFIDCLHLIDKADPTNADGRLEKEEMMEILTAAADLKRGVAANSA